MNFGLFGPSWYMQLIRWYFISLPFLSVLFDPIFLNLYLRIHKKYKLIAGVLLANAVVYITTSFIPFWLKGLLALSPDGEINFIIHAIVFTILYNALIRALIYRLMFWDYSFKDIFMIVLGSETVCILITLLSMYILIFISRGSILKTTRSKFTQQA